MTAQIEAGSDVRCVTCSARLTGRFCAECGEENAGARDYSIRHFLADVVAAFTNADGKIFRTVRTLVARPGALTVEFLEGRRKPWVAPLQLFLILNLVFFVAQPIIGWNTFTTPLRVHLSGMPYQELAGNIVTREVAIRGMTLSELSREFDAAAEVHAKTLIIAMVPMFALFVAAAYITKRRYFAHHLVFALHFYALVLLFEVAVFALAQVVIRVLLAIGLRFTDATIDATLSLATVLILGIYLYFALRTAYGERALTTVLKTAALTCAIAVVLQLYRLLLFFVTIYSI